MSNGDDPVLDPQAVLRSFSSKLRGYDSDEVDAHLRSIAGALRSASRETTTTGPELDEAKETIDRLRAEISRLEARIEELEEAGGSETIDGDLEPFDEHRAMQLLGEETTRVLETARQSAATIVASAEAKANERTEAVEAMETRVSEELSELRTSTENELAEMRSATEQELDALRQTTEADVAEQRSAAAKRIDEQAAAANESAEKIVADAKAEAKESREAAKAASAAAKEEAAGLLAAASTEAAELRTKANADAGSVRAEADTDAARVRAEAEADVMAAQESARETARLMVVEAQRVREKVLSDLVVRRRQGRQQVDQAKAARDRLARALHDVRQQIDASVNELDVSLPEAKAALSDLSRPEAPTDDEAQIRELEAELDAARSKADGDAVVVASGSAALAPARTRKSPAPDRSAGGDHTAEQPAAQAESGGGSSPDSDTEAADAAEAGGVDPSTPTDSEEEEVEEEIEVPEPFRTRDVAMTRHGADLRRKLKRVMADEQSDLLDRLQRSKHLSVDDLADAAELRSLYADAVAPALRATAAAGATMHGGEVDRTSVDALVERLVGDLFDSLRARVEESVASATDIDDVLEPLRAHYRDVRLSDVPGLTDDALAEAFALGAYAALPNGTAVRWISDPRFEPSSDCFDDTLANDVSKPDGFPTGRTHPTGQPGCRCLVVPSDDL